MGLHGAFLGHSGIIGHLLSQGGSCLLPILDVVGPVRWSFPVLAAPQGHCHVTKGLPKRGEAKLGYEAQGRKVLAG